MTQYIDLLRAHQQTKPQEQYKQQQDDVSLLLDEHEAPSTTETVPALDGLLDEAPEANPTPDSTIQPTHNDTPKPKPKQSSTPPQQPTTDPEQTRQWLQQCIKHVQQLFEQAEQHTTFHINPLTQHLNTLLQQLQHDHEQHHMDALELQIARHTQYMREQHARLGSLIQKSILMMLYAIKTGTRLKLGHEPLKNHVLAAMLHHIGMAQIDASIRNKKERLNKKELKIIHAAPVQGVEYLESCGIEDRMILDACLQAGERFDGSGSTGLSGNHIAWSARLVGALSMFEALIHYRPYRKRLLPRDAIREMVKHHKQAFDPDILKALIESISLYPIGTYVQVNTGEIGLVIHIHPYRPLRPVVHICMDHHAQPIPERDIDLTTQPNLTVEQCMYKEDTLKLAEKHEHAA